MDFPDLAENSGQMALLSRPRQDIRERASPFYENATYRHDCYADRGVTELSPLPPMANNTHAPQDTQHMESARFFISGASKTNYRPG